MAALTQHNVNERILQDVISALRKDWDLTEAEDELLDHISHRMMQQFPDKDVRRPDVVEFISEVPDLFSRVDWSRKDVLDLLFNA